MINGYDNSGNLAPIYYDAPEYLDFWKPAETLDVPIYIHPRTVPDDREKPYPELRGAAWGFHVETAEHILRMIISGLFDKVPNIKIILGHLGEFLPFWCYRIDHRIQREGWDGEVAAKNGRPRKLSVTEYVQRNIYATTTRFFYTPALDHALQVLGTGHIMYSMDYPYEKRVKLPGIFAKINERGVPLPAIWMTMVVGLLALLTYFFSPDKAFVWLISIVGLAIVFSWLEGAVALMKMAAIPFQFI